MSETLAPYHAPEISDLSAWDNGQHPVDCRPHNASFAFTLRELRQQRRLSQSRLAEAAGFDHSYVSRLESGSRMPTREAVASLADAMHLDEASSDVLLSSAGFMPNNIDNLMASEPVLTQCLHVLRDTTISRETRNDVRTAILLIVQMARRDAA